LQAAIADFGTPAEVATAYREVERRVPVTSTSDAASHVLRNGFFAVYGDIRAWSSLLYMMLCFWLGVGYLMWTILGLTASVSFSILIIGLPLALAFLFSIRGIALLEGRLVEGLLGVRMPRRRVFFPRYTRWLDQLRGLLNDKHTWLTLSYASMLWLAGTIYLCLILIGGGGSLFLITSPIVQEWTGEAILSFFALIYVPRWLYPLPIVAGFLIFTLFLHLARVIGRMHARIAKSLLVDESDVT